MPRPVKLDYPTPRAFTADRLRGMDTGTILRNAEGVRAVRIAEWDRNSGWLLEPGDTLASDERVADMGSWAIEAYAPRRDSRDRLKEQVVYVDLDGTGRKVYVGRVAKWELRDYEQKRKAYEKAKAKGESVRPPASPRAYIVQHKGKEYIIVPDEWYGVTTALAWHTLDAKQSRRSEAAQRADRRVLSPPLARALEAMVYATLPRWGGYRGSSYPLSVIREDLTENRQNVFERMEAGNAGFYPWETVVEPTSDDTALLFDASHRRAVQERLIGRALRQLIAEGRVVEVGGRYAQPDTGRRLEDAQRDYQRVYDEGKDALARAEAALRRRSGDYYYGTSDYNAVNALRDALLAALRVAQHPFHTDADVAALVALQTDADALATRLERVSA
jgi:hypothetical protein